MATCRSCGAEIRWIKTRNGKNMPVDPEEYYVLEGAVTENRQAITFVSGDGRIIRGVTVRPENPLGEICYISHFATCPYADQHRKGM